MNQWLERQEPNIATNTHRFYKNSIETHINPEIGNLSLQNLKPYHIKDLYEKMSNKYIPGKKSRKKISPRTILSVHQTLRPALKEAVKMKIIKNNPIISVKPPRQIKKKFEVYTVNVLRNLFEFDKDRNIDKYNP